MERRHPRNKQIQLLPLTERSGASAGWPMPRSAHDFSPIVDPHWRAARGLPCGQTSSTQALRTGSLPWGTLWLLRLLTVEVSKVYQRPRRWKGENPTASSLVFHEPSPSTEKQRSQFLQEGSRTEKKTRASLPQLPQNKILFCIQGPPLSSSTLLFSSYSKGFSSWVNITGISQILIPILPSPLKRLCPAHFHLSKSYLPLKTQFKTLLPMNSSLITPTGRGDSPLKFKENHE